MRFGQQRVGRVLRRYGLLSAAVLAVSASAGAGTNASVRPARVVPLDNMVTAIAHAGHAVYVAGYFSTLGVRGGPFSVFSRRNGRLSAGLRAFTGDTGSSGGSPVSAIVGDGAGGWFVAGNFAAVGGVRCPGLAHVLRAGTLDRRFCLPTDGAILTMARIGSRLYVGGTFTRIGGKTRLRLAAVDLATAAVDGWRADVTGVGFSDNHGCCDLTVEALTAVGSRLYVGGFFDHVAGSPHVDIAAIDAAGGRVLDWDPHLHAPPPADVTAVAATANRVFFTGRFDAVGAVRRGYAAAVSAATAAPTVWNPSPNGIPDVLAVDAAGVYVAGSFGRIGGAKRAGLARVDAVSGKAQAWDPRPNGAVYAIAPAGSTVYLGGAFTKMQNAPRTSLAAVDRTSGRPTGWGPPAAHGFSTEGGIVALAVAGDRIAAGGDVSGYGGVMRRGLAALGTRSGAATGWDPGSVDGTVNTMVAYGSTLYLGGNFRHIGGAARSGLAAFDLKTGKLTAWSPRVRPEVADLPDPGEVNTIAVSGSTVYVGGYFTAVGGRPRSSLAAVDARTGAVLPWHANLRGRLTGGIGQADALSVAGDTVYVGGEFTSAGVAPRTNMAAIDAVTGKTLPWTPAVATDDKVSALAVAGSSLYVGIDSVLARPRVVCVSIRSGLVRWRAELADEVPGITAIRPLGHDVFVSGDFRSVAGKPHENLVALESETGRPLPWSPLLPDSVDAMVLGPVNVYAAAGTALYAFAGPRARARRSPRRVYPTRPKSPINRLSR